MSAPRPTQSPAPQGRTSALPMRKLRLSGLWPWPPSQHCPCDPGARRHLAHFLPSLALGAEGGAKGASEPTLRKDPGSCLGGNPPAQKADRGRGLQAEATLRAGLSWVQSWPVPPYRQRRQEAPGHSPALSPVHSHPFPQGVWCSPGNKLWQRSRAQASVSPSVTQDAWTETEMKRRSSVDIRRAMSD